MISGLFSDRVLAAVAGTVGEFIGFYGLIATVEWRRERTRGYGWRLTTISTARLLLAEFGLIEVLDSTAVRPLFMYLGPGITGGLGTGTLLGKLMADVVFYGVAIVCYELVRRRRREKAALLADAKTVALVRAAPVKAVPVKATARVAVPARSAAAGRATGRATGSSAA